MRKLRFVWIDDQPNKVNVFRRPIEIGVNQPKRTASLELIEVKNELLDTLKDWTASNEGRPPDLFIIDHVFNAALPFKLNGSSVAHLLRNTFPATPMVCVTAKYDSAKSFDQEDLSEYTALFAYSQLNQSLDALFTIARDFPKLSRPASNVKRHLVASLRAPKRDWEELLLLLPEEFQNPKHAATQHRMARWIYNVLLPRPGFLYDRLHVATLLGLKTNGFAKVESRFAKALYRGVFAMKKDPRWWVSEVYRLLFSGTGESGPSVPQIAGRALPGIERDDFSVCYVSRSSDPPPDIVAMADATRTAEPRVVRREFAKQHPNDPGTAPGFETRHVLAKKRT
jgi:hypothetical protein